VNRLVAAVLLAVMGSVFPLRAQDAAPTALPLASIGLPDARLLAFFLRRRYADRHQRRRAALYDSGQPARLRQVVTLPLDGPAVALAAADFTLVAVATTGAADSLVVIAPDPYSRGGFGVVNFLDAPKGIHLIALSPARKWALASGDDAYVTLALSAADNIEVSAPVPVGDTPLIGAALTDDTALLIHHDSPRVAAAPLDPAGNATPQPAALALDAPAVAIAVSGDGALGAVALKDKRLVLFDPSTLKILNTVTLEDGLSGEVYS